MENFLPMAAWICRGISLAIVSGAVDVYAQPDDGLEEPIDEVVVVAHKHGRPVSEIAANVTVLSSTEIRNTLSTSLADVFRYTPGIDHEAGSSRFGTEGINIRGIGGNRVAMLVDGVPLSDQFDVGSFSNATRDFVNAGLIDSIEVLHGPASALYGSAAIGGVVAMRTPDPAQLLSRRGPGYGVGGDLVALYRGADNSLHSTGMVAFGDAERGVLVAGSLRDGKQTDSAAVNEPLDFRDYRRRSVLAKFVAGDRLGNRWRIGFIHQDADVQSDLNSMLGTGRFRRTTALEGDDEYAMELLNLAYEFGDSDGLFDAGVVRGYYQAADVQQTTLDERGLAARPVSIDRFFRYQQDTRGVEVNLQKSLTGASVEHRLAFGLEYRQRDTEEYRDGLERGIDDGLQTNVLLGEVFPLRDFPISRSSEWGAYVEDVVDIGDWTLIAALRGDSYSLDPQNDSLYAEDFPFAEPVALSESDISPKLGLIYHLSDVAEVYLQYAHGFRAPPYEDANIGLEVPLFNYRAIPNPDLTSEKSDGVDLGLRWRGAKSEFRIAFFHTRYTDFIESKVRIGTDPVSGRLLFQSQNLARTVIEGVEGGWKADFSGRLRDFSADLSFYAVRGENKENGEPLNSVGPGQLVAGLTWAPADRPQSARLQGAFAERWSRRDETSGELFQPPGYAAFDFYFMQQLGQRLTARIGLLNLTDRTYWRWSDVRGLSSEDPAIPFLAQAGRSISVSLNLNLH